MTHETSGLAQVVEIHEPTVRACIAALPKFRNPYSTVHDKGWNDCEQEARKNLNDLLLVGREAGDNIHDFEMSSKGPYKIYGTSVPQSVNASLSPDQRDASEPRQSAHGFSAPVDHGPGADGDGEAGTFADGVRAALEAVDEAWHIQSDEHKMDSVAVHNWRLGRDAVAALLPKQDRAEELAKRWDREECQPSCHAPELGDVRAFARWLINEGLVK